MEGESGEQVKDELWLWHHQQSDLCKADGTRQEVDSRDEVMRGEMSDWWLLQKMQRVERGWQQTRSENYEGLNITLQIFTLHYNF